MARSFPLLAVLLLAVACSFAWADFAADCKTNKFPVQLCTTITGRWAKNPTVTGEYALQFCHDYEDDEHRDACIALFDGGVFDEKGKDTVCNEDDLMALCPTAEEIRAANAPNGPTMLFSQVRSQMRSKERVAACTPPLGWNANAALNNIGHPVSVKIDFGKWGNPKRDRERPYQEPAIRITVEANNANQGCVLNPEPAYNFCNGNAFNPNTKDAANCVGANDALHTAACPTGKIAAQVGNFFGAAGFLDTYFGAPVNAFPKPVGNPSSWLWAVDSCGNLKLGDEYQNRHAPAAFLARGTRPIKHGDLIPTPNGDDRGVGRTGGEIKRVSVPAGGGGGNVDRWLINSCSSYVTLRARKIMPGLSSLTKSNMCHAFAYFTAQGFDTANTKMIMCADFFAQNWAHCLNCANPAAPVYQNC